MPISFSDERGTGTFHSLGPLPCRKHATVLYNDDDIRALPHPPSPAPLSLPRRASAPILLANGKPLKSSLKSSPSISIPPDAQRPHLRARSEPSTPAKNVHFPEKDSALATIHVYPCSACPASLSCSHNQTETAVGKGTPPSGFPFIPVRYEIDPLRSSSVPCQFPSCPHVIIETLHLPCSAPSTNTILSGTVLVANLAFEKNVAIRFTLDDWQTVSEVSAHYHDSVSILPSHIFSPSTPPSVPSPRGWDRFSFTICLADYVHSLGTRILWLAARFRIESTYAGPGDVQYGPGGEWWDNNHGTNYRVAFRPAVTAPRPHPETLPEPITPLCGQPQPPTTSEVHTSDSTILSRPCKVDNADKHSIPLPTRKLCLSNYASPTTSSSAPVPLLRPRQNVSLCRITLSEVLTSTRALSQSDEDMPSPDSSTLSTPSELPMIAPRAFINEHSTASFQPYQSHKDDSVALAARLGHIAGWDWPASSQKLRNDLERLSEQRANPNPMLGFVAPEQNLTPQGRSAQGCNEKLYDAFVMRWCFAQGPSPHGHGDGGVMA